MNTNSNRKGALFLFALVCSSIASANVSSTAFYDDFGSGIVDASKWYAARRNFDSWHAYYSGGVVPENLYVRNGVLQCEAHGDLYQGTVAGFDESGKERFTRVGACAVTRDFFASGRYEIRAKVAPVLGVCSAMWTYAGGTNKNQEIDFQMPGRPASANENIDFGHALCNTICGEKNYECQKAFVSLAESQDDGNFHTYRFDWHTGGADHGTNITARVEFYVDGVLVRTNTSHVPTRAARFWVGAWFPKDWAGTPSFDTRIFEVDWVRITPFNEANDEEPEEGVDHSTWLVEPTNVVPPELWAVGSPVEWDVMARLNENGELVLSGSGAVKDFSSAADVPWAAVASSIKSLVLGEGITEIGQGSFAGLYNLETVNGTSLARYAELLAATGKSDPGIGGTTATNLTVSIYQSSDLVNWEPIEGEIKLGADGQSVDVPVSSSSNCGFFKLVAQ